MRRLLVNIFTSLCLAICVASACLWVRSYVKNDYIEWRGRFAQVHFGWGYGTMFVGLSNLRHQEPSLIVYSRELVRSTNYFQHSDKPNILGVLGFNYENADFRPGNGFPPEEWPGRPTLSGPVLIQRLMTFPFFAAVFISAVAPLVQLRWILRRACRWRRGLCLNCGYDLRATPLRCPECGHTTR